MSLDADVQAVADNGATFQNKLADTLRGLIGQNNERKSEIAALRGDHEELKKNHEAFVTSAERENDLRRNEIKSLEEKMLKASSGFVLGKSCSKERRKSSALFVKLSYKVTK